jgi:hypothetical protein
LVLLSTSCKKDDNNPIVNTKTLEELYPDWANLTWVSTKENGVFVEYPRFEIMIVGDTITLKGWSYIDEDNNIFYNPQDYKKISFDTITSTTGTVTISDLVIKKPYGDGITFGYIIDKSNNNIILAHNNHIYTLKIN